jgi:hypothetical protein
MVMKDMREMRPNAPGSRDENERKRIEKSRQEGAKKVSDKDRLSNKDDRRSKPNSGRGYDTMDDDEVNIL